MFAACLSVGPGYENARPWSVAYSTMVLTVMAGVVGAVAGAWRPTRRLRILDLLIVVAALGGAANEVFADRFPVSGHYRDAGAALSVAALLVLPALVLTADIAARRRTGVAETG